MGRRNQKNKQAKKVVQTSDNHEQEEQKEGGSDFTFNADTSSRIQIDTIINPEKGQQFEKDDS
jgi:hypothetical protein